MGFENFKPNNEPIGSESEPGNKPEEEPGDKPKDELKKGGEGMTRRAALGVIGGIVASLAKGKPLEAADKMSAYDTEKDKAAEGYDYHKDPKALKEIQAIKDDINYREGRSEPETGREAVKSSVSEHREAPQPGHIVDKMKKWAEKWKRDKKSEEIRKIKPQENMDPHAIAREMLRLFDTDELKRFFPGEIFTSDFFIAQTFQESRGDKNAVSATGAKGVLQNFPGSVIDAVEYLDAMRREGLIPYHGPSRIKSKTQAKKIIDYFQENVNYGRAAGKIYEQAIFNPVYKYNSGLNKNAFRGKSNREIQRMILVSYHDGPGARYKSDEQLIAAAKARAKKTGRKFRIEDSAVYYYKKIFGYMDQADFVRRTYRKNGFKIKYEDTAADQMLHVFERYLKSDKKDEARALTEKFMKMLKDKIEELGRDLSRGEIMDVFRLYIKN